MTEEFVAKKPDFKGDGVAVWNRTTKEGKPYLHVKILGSVGVNCFENKQKD